MTLGLRTTAATVIAAGFLLVPALADAQGRRAVPRPVLRSRPAVRVGVYYGPSIYYRPWYGSRYYGWYDPFYFPHPYYYGGWYPPYYYGGGYYDISGSMRLQVSPRQTQVFVDGYFAGTVDDFDGVFQRLRLEPGEHDVELFLPGHRSYQQKVYLQPGRTFNVRHAMEPLGPGDAEPVRPNGGNRPATSPRPRRSEGLPPREPRDRDDRDRDASRPAARSEFGTLALRVQPGDATVTIDGEPWETGGDNERLIVQLGAGVHTVQIRKDGYRTYMTDVTIRPGETSTLNVAMTPNGGR